MSTFSFWQKDDLGPSIACDVAVVGGGIIGCSTAYWLKKVAPTLNVAIVEAHTTGYGASGRNAGFLLQGAAVDFATDIERYGEMNADLLWTFTTENRRLIEAELGADRIGFETSGSMLLAGDEAEAERLRQSAAWLQERRVNASYLTAQDVRSKTRGTGFHGGLTIETGGCLHSLKLVREIAGTSGAQILEHHPVVSIDETETGVRLQTPRRLIEAGRVVLALNAYLPNLLPETAGLIRPVRAQMLSTRPLPRWLHAPIYTHEGYYYLRQWTDGSLLLGGARHLFAAEEVGYEDRTTERLQQALLDYLHTYFPETGPVNVDRRWSGVMGFTENGLPCIRLHSERLWWAAGFNGHGMGYGFRFGRLLADMLLGQETGGCERLFTLPLS